MRSPAFAVALLAALLSTAAAAAERSVVIHAGRLIDGVTKAARGPTTVVVTDGRIAAVLPGLVDGPAGSEILDLSHDTVLPGLIDCHDHLTATWHTGDPIRNAVTRTEADDAVEATVSARDTLMAGFTSIRDVGGATAVVTALRRAIDAGVVPGPRMWVSGAPLGPTGGHGDPANGLDPELSHPHWTESLIDGPESARRAVRTLRRQGADLVKIMPSGGVMSIGDDPALQLMQDDEIRAVVETAHALGMKVAAHAHGRQAIDRSVALGVDSVEHGTFGQAGSYALMRQHGTYLVPTLLVGQRVYQRAREHPEQLNPSTVQKALAVVPRARRNLHDAYVAGVRIAFGTDTFGLSRHGENAQEFALMVDAGMKPIDAIWAATHDAADLVGASADVGSIAPGRLADIIAVTADPLQDIRALEHVSFVMKGGKVVRSDPRP